MYKYLIVSDLHPDTKHIKLTDSIAKIGESLRFFENAWIVKTDFRPDKIREIFEESLSKKDYFVVSEINRTTGSLFVLPQDALDWMSK